MSEETTITQCLILLKAAYPRQELPDETIDVYEMSLRDVDPELLKTAVLQHISTSKWFPTVAELRAAAAGIIRASRDQLSAPEAWGVVTQQMRRFGRWRSPEFDDPLIERAVQAIGGWDFLCASENIAADRARFIQAYQQLEERQANEAMALPAVRRYTQALKSGEVNGAVKQLADKMRGET